MEESGAGGWGGQHWGKGRMGGVQWELRGVGCGEESGVWDVEGCKDMEGSGRPRGGSEGRGGAGRLGRMEQMGGVQCRGWGTWRHGEMGCCFRGDSHGQCEPTGLWRVATWSVCPEGGGDLSVGSPCLQGAYPPAQLPGILRLLC